MNEITQKTGVLITLILCGTAVILGLLGTIAWLIYAQRDVQVIVGLVTFVLTAFLYKRLSDVDARTARVEQHVNGNTARLMDAALPTPSVASAPPDAR